MRLLNLTKLHVHPCLPWSVLPHTHGPTNDTGGATRSAWTATDWPHVVGGCIRSAPELSRRPPACRCSSRRCDEGRCRRCRPFDSCAPRMVGGAQQSTLRPLDRAAANLAAAGTMESCAMILRGVHPWGLARPSKLSVPGELLAAVRKGGRPMRPTLACDQWLFWQHRGHHRRCRAQRVC